MKIPNFINQFVTKLQTFIRVKQNKAAMTAIYVTMVYKVVDLSNGYTNIAFEHFMEHSRIFIKLAKDRVYDEHRLNVIKEFRGTFIRYANENIVRLDEMVSTLQKAFDNHDISKYTLKSQIKRIESQKLRINKQLRAVEGSTLHIDNINIARERTWSWN